jgi:hypothetical protein
MPSPHRPVLLVGSFPFKTAREVFDVAGPLLAGYAARLPDGEAQGWNTFPAATLARAQGLVPSGLTARSQPGLPAYDLYRLADGVRPDDVRFAPIGYDAVALKSYETFRQARQAGTIGPGTRFQVSLPTPFATIGARIVPEHVAAVLPIFEQHYFGELDRILAAIPAADLAIQWDIAVEIIQSLLGNRPGLKEYAPMEFLAAALARASGRVPADVELGLHFCYGNPGGRHIIEPDDTGLMVKFANRILALVPRAVTWLHMPVPRNRDDDAYFAPLRELRLPQGTELYLGLVHLSDGLEGSRKRLETAKKYAPHFGVGWECGLRAFAPNTIADMLRLHKAVADLN